MDLQRIAQQFKAPKPPLRARFGSVVQVNADYTVDVLVGGMTTDADEEAAYSSGFVAMEGSGGTIGTVEIDDVEYRVHLFSTAGTMTVGTVGENAVLEAFVVGGGGAGGGAAAGEAGGGGAGGRIVQLSLDPVLGDYVVASLGTAGLGVSGAAGGSGGDTQLTLPDSSVVIAVGGGGGGTAAGVSGGSGGGAGAGTAGAAGGTATPGIGFGSDGGKSVGGTAFAERAGGGGGGASSDGVGGNKGGVGGAGGAGLVIENGTLATNFFYGAGGGGGGGTDGGSSGTGLSGGGGSDADGSSAQSARGNGGGGGAKSATASTGGNGSAGAVIFRYRITPDDIVPNTELEVSSDQVEGVPFLGQGVPIPGQTVLLLTDGQDLVALDSLAQAGSTISPRRYRTSAQTIPNDTETVVTWGTAVANDLLGMAGPAGGTAWNNRLYAHIPGWYQAAGAAEWDADPDGWRRVTIRFNGTAVLAAQQADTDANLVFWQQVSTPTFYMAAGDFVDMTVQHTDGSPLDLVYENEYVPSLSLTFLGP